MRINFIYGLLKNAKANYSVRIINGYFSRCLFSIRFISIFKIQNDLSRVCLLKVDTLFLLVLYFYLDKLKRICSGR